MKNKRSTYLILKLSFVACSNDKRPYFFGKLVLLGSTIRAIQWFGRFGRPFIMSFGYLFQNHLSPLLGVLVI